MDERKTWVVTISADRPMPDLAKDLTKAGFSVDQMLEEIGSITGIVDEESIEKFRGVCGVFDIVPEVPIDVGPPDAGIS